MWFHLFIGMRTLVELKKNTPTHPHTLCHLEIIIKFKNVNNLY